MATRWRKTGMRVVAAIAAALMASAVLSTAAFAAEPAMRTETASAEFDRLFLVSEDWSYRRQLEELFRLCTPDDPPRPRGLRRFVAALATLGTALAVIATWLTRTRLAG